MKRGKSAASVLFVYPPSVDPTVPPISHSRLKPWIKSSSFVLESEFLDENISFVYHAISTVLNRGHKDSSHKNFSKTLEERQIKNSKYNYNIHTNKDDHEVSNRNEKENILKSIGILKSKLFYNISHYVAANSWLDYLFAKFSKFYYPSQIGYANAKLIYSPYHSDEIKRALKDESKNPFINFFISRLGDYGFKNIVGISVIYSSQIIAALTLAMLYHERYPDSLIMLGGPALYHIRKDLMKDFNFIDLIVQLDGEHFFGKCSYLFDQIINSRTNKENIKDFINSNNCFGFYDLNGPIPEYDFISFNKYILPDPVVSLDITRGCYYRKCVFCAYGFNTAPYRVMPVESVIKTIKNLEEKYNINNFLFSVDTVDPKYLELLSEKIINSGIKINYYLDSRMERRFTDRLFVNKLAKSGCRVVSFGMESACKNTLLRMKKGIDPNYFHEIFQNLYGHDIHININLIHGFPGETSNELQRTIDFINANEKFITTVGVSEFTLLRGSIMEKEYKNYGIDSIYPEGDLFIWYKIHDKNHHKISYPNFNRFLNRLLRIFPVYGRLTGSTSDYLLYASRYSPDEIKQLLKKAVELKLNKK